MVSAFSGLGLSCSFTPRLFLALGGGVMGFKWPYMTAVRLIPLPHSGPRKGLKAFSLQREERPESLLQKWKKEENSKVGSQWQGCAKHLKELFQSLSLQASNSHIFGNACVTTLNVASAICMCACRISDLQTESASGSKTHKLAWNSMNPTQLFPRSCDRYGRQPHNHRKMCSFFKRLHACIRFCLPHKHSKAACPFPS